MSDINVFCTIFYPFLSVSTSDFMSHAAAPGPGADRNRKRDIVRDTGGTMAREC